MRNIQISVTLGALAIALVHVVWPNLAIDSITIGLLVLAAIPWLAPLFKSLEFPGGWKFELREMAKTTERAEIAGLLDTPEKSALSTESAFQSLVNQDPNLALGALRSEIERRLVQLADAGGIELKLSGLGYLLKTLEKHNLLTSEQQSVLAQILGMLNASVHGPVVNHLAVVWVLETGPRLLRGLDTQIEKIGQHSRRE